MSVARRLWWVWASWAVLAAVVQWHRVQLAGHEEAAAMRGQNAVLLGKIRDGERRIADLGERAALRCEATQGEMLRVLGAARAVSSSRCIQGVAVGPLSSTRLDGEQH